MATLLLVMGFCLGVGFRHTDRSRRMHDNVRAALKVADVPRKALDVDKGYLSRALNNEDGVQLSLSKMAEWPDEFWQWFVRIVGLDHGLVVVDGRDVLDQVKPRMAKADLPAKRQEQSA